jgi:hypothetical protein
MRYPVTEIHEPVMDVSFFPGFSSLGAHWVFFGYPLDIQNPGKQRGRIEVEYGTIGIAVR